MYRLMIIEDDRGIAEAIEEQARMWELDTRIAQNFRNIVAEFAEYEPHMILLDISLPFFNGYHWCSEIRKVSKVPIIFISSAADNMNIVMAMNMGADDFVAKPFDALHAKSLILCTSCILCRGLIILGCRGLQALTRCSSGFLLFPVRFQTN